MGLNVDPHELVGAAKKLAGMAHQTGMVLPRGWVVPAGADPISAAAVPHLNGEVTKLINGVIDTINKIQDTAYKVGAAAAEYTETDDEGARKVGGGGGEIVPNPIGTVTPLGPRVPPDLRFPAAGAAVDPLTFAEGLHNGPGPGAATGFADAVRKFSADAYTAATTGVGDVSQLMRNWTPVGSKAAGELDRHRGRMDELGRGLGKLADGIEGYSNAFRAAKAKHPTPQEIKAARKELLAAIHSKNKPAITRALYKFNEQNERSTTTIADYSSEVGAKVPADKDATAGQGTGGGTGAAAGAGQGAGDTSMLTSMLPMLMSGMQGMQSMQQNQGMDEYIDGADDYSYGDYGDLGIPSGFGGGGGGGGGGDYGVPAGLSSEISKSQEFVASAMPMVGAASSLASGSPLPRASVIEPLNTASGAAAGAAGRGGSPMMPYMPMSPGMGGPGGAGGGGDRSRVVAWHPDRLMYVDNTPHTDLVIGERPTIAPTVTPPTPAPANQSPSQPGGTA
ncbi:PPE domain-containing protein [Nocardia australiensis]|uniref:PPE domain-containing protein n=1 Tax=Nocardia australiensis TaxID=2887191 RepID=UPI001D142749|nr:PPE domain-containing protein [Nocardia australiensis]